MHQEDGSSLSLGQQLCGREQSAILCPLHGECVWYCCFFSYNILWWNCWLSFALVLEQIWLWNGWSVCMSIIINRFYMSNAVICVYCDLWLLLLSTVKKTYCMDWLMYLITSKQMFTVIITNKLFNFFVLL